jgi:DNA-binding NarL/FixJ family response regulator
MSEFNDHVKTVLSKYAPEHAANQIALELLNPYGGSEVYVSIPFEERNKKIVQLSKQGVHIEKIAGEFCLTVRSVQKIIKNSK